MAARRRASCYSPCYSLPYCLLLLLSLNALRSSLPVGVEAALLQGCDFGDDLCDTDEVCIPDGLFGQCFSDRESELVKPLLLNQPLDAFQQQLLRLELTRLASNGLDWPHARSQCILAYFKLSIAYNLEYDTEFCSVQNPNNIWSLIQRVQNVLAVSEEEAEEANAGVGTEEQEAILVPESLLEDGQSSEQQPQSDEIAIPVILIDEDAASQLSDTNVPSQQIYEVVLEDDALPDSTEGAENSTNADTQVKTLSKPDDLEKQTKTTNQALNKVFQELMREKATEPGQVKRSSGQQNVLTAEEEAQLDDYVRDILKDKTPAMKGLSANQLDRLVNFVTSLENVIETEDVRSEKPEVSEVEEIIPLTVDSDQEQVLLLNKKDLENFNNADMGLANTVHKIVKGGIQRVEGNRVYLKVAKEKLTEEELYKLIGYLDAKIAEPNDLYFDEFLYDNGQLSFKIYRAGAAAPFHPRRQDKKEKKGLENASGVAQAVYKRRKDIQTLAGVEVDETGIGSGADVVPVERSERDLFFLPILAICALTITSLVSVLAVQLYRNRRNRNYKNNLPEVIDHLEGKPSTVYEDLCRQRMMASQDIPVSVNVVGTKSKHSSTSSWPDDSLLQSSDLDISTGHVILSFLQNCLDKPQEISAQWDSVASYKNRSAQNLIAKSNADKNYDLSVLPYDDSVVTINQTTLVDVYSEGAPSTYINASKIHDSDPQQVAYIATQSPLKNTTSDFWQMIWQEGIALIVNLCDQEDMKSQKCAKYWPEEGSKTFGPFEIHLVSEHIWSEDYVVRSLYLKNMKTNETRTVTQFHYLTWPEGGCPTSNKSLLEFRRKVNKSYRGRASPIVVHCTNGAGRTGAYCLIDMAMNRILNGLKELNIAGSLEYLRDQRMGMVENESQYKLVFNCVAEEVSSLLKNLQH